MIWLTILLHEIRNQKINPTRKPSYLTTSCNLQLFELSTQLLSMSLSLFSVPDLSTINAVYIPAHTNVGFGQAVGYAPGKTATVYPARSKSCCSWYLEEETSWYAPNDPSLTPFKHNIEVSTLSYIQCFAVSNVVRKFTDHRLSKPTWPNLQFSLHHSM